MDGSAHSVSPVSIHAHTLKISETCSASAQQQ
uniref:Uncharacterized protein n=1 Tax=Anguilla anguilla TaxID=7936 RepID=A0A0E9XM14_ANGAN